MQRLPAFSKEGAINSKDKVIENTDEMKKQEREEFILNFISGRLFFVSVVGEAAAASLTGARSLIRFIGAAGEVSLLVYHVTKDFDDAFMTMFSYLASASVGRGGSRNAADPRRGMTSKDNNSLGSFKTNLDRVETIRGAIYAI